MVILTYDYIVIIFEKPLWGKIIKYVCMYDAGTKWHEIISV